MKTLAAALTAIAIVASPALAHRAPVSPAPTPTGSVFSGSTYLGQDPDPAVRADLLRQGASWNIGG